jgi:hypothetical protein
VFPDVRAWSGRLVETSDVIAALADFVLLETKDGGLKAAMGSPSRSLLLHTDAGQGIGPVVLGVLIATPSGEPLTPGRAVVVALYREDERFTFPSCRRE